MPYEFYETQEDDPEEPTNPNEVRLALSWLFSSTGVLDYEDSPWSINLDGANGVEFDDEENGTTAYIPPGTDGDITGGSSGGDGADPTATYVTTDDESTDLENSQQHSNLSGDDLHDPATHGDSEHDETVPSQSDVDAKADDPHAIGGDSHDSDTLENLNSKIDDATLDDSSEARPPEDHDNAAHSAAFLADGDGTERQIWIIANGASDPSGAGPEDIIFEEEA